MFKRIFMLLAVMLTFTACGSSGVRSYNSYKTVESFDSNNGFMDTNANYVIDTTDFDKDEKALTELTKDYVINYQSLSINDDKKRLDLSVGVPTDKTYEFEEGLKDIGKTISKNKEGTNKEDEVSNNSVELAAKEEELQTYKDLYAEASTVEEKTELQEKISAITSDIAWIKQREGNLNKEIIYSDYIIALNEVYDYDLDYANIPKVSTTFKKSAKGSIVALRIFLSLVISLVIGLWWVILLVILIVFVIKKVRKKNEKNIDS